MSKIESIELMHIANPDKSIFGEVDESVEDTGYTNDKNVWIKRIYEFRKNLKLLDSDLYMPDLSVPDLYLHRIGNVAQYFMLNPVIIFKNIQIESKSVKFSNISKIEDFIYSEQTAGKIILPYDIYNMRYVNVDTFLKETTLVFRFGEYIT